MRKQDSSKSGTPLPLTTNFYSNEDWRFEVPVWDTEKCILCGVCFLSCPDGAIYQNAEGYYEADTKFCKGCGLCRRQCWTSCISMEIQSETPPWVVLVKKIIP